MAEDGVVAAGQQRPGLERERRRDLVAHQIDAAVDLVEAAGGEPQLDLVAGHAPVEQLPPRHHPVLSRREPRDHPVRESTGDLNGYIPFNPALDWGAPVAGRRPAR
jgi:hypothetical protein